MFKTCSKFLNLMPLSKSSLASQFHHDQLDMTPQRKMDYFSFLFIYNKGLLTLLRLGGGQNDPRLYIYG